MGRQAKFSNELLEAALIGLGHKRAVIERNIQEVRAALGGQMSSISSNGPRHTNGKRQLSEEARARIAAAQRERWAKAKARQKRANK